MKKLWILVIAVLFCGCNLNQQETKYLAAQILIYDKDSDSYISPAICKDEEYIDYFDPLINVVNKKRQVTKYLSLKVGDTFYAHYFLLPESNDTIQLDSIITDFNITEIESVDKDNCIIKCKAKTKGKFNFKVITSNFNSVSTYPIKVSE